MTMNYRRLMRFEKNTTVIKWLFESQSVYLTIGPASKTFSTAKWPKTVIKGIVK